MKVWSAVNDSHDGIVDIKLFQSEMLAKMFCRKVNKQCGYNRYEVKEFTVYDSIENSEIWRYV
jgi:peptide subunit release factor 1 (eRF1)